VTAEEAISPGEGSDSDNPKQSPPEAPKERLAGPGDDEEVDEVDDEVGEHAGEKGVGEGEPEGQEMHGASGKPGAENNFTGFSMPGQVD